MIAVKTQSPLNSQGLVRRRYEVTLTDSLGNSHIEVVGIFNHQLDNDGSLVEADLLVSKKEQEIDYYKEHIINEHNPFVENELLWNSKTEMLKSVLDDALSKEATEFIVLHGLPYMALVTDDELRFLYSQTQEWVDSVRQKVSDLLAAKALLDNYEPLLGSVE